MIADLWVNAIYRSVETVQVTIPGPRVQHHGQPRQSAATILITPQRHHVCFFNRPLEFVFSNGPQTNVHAIQLGLRVPVLTNAVVTRQTDGLPDQLVRVFAAGQTLQLTHSATIDLIWATASPRLTIAVVYRSP